ncbi:hypothetical protein [Pseudonocardia sp.]|jgi:hypothetical protein|uniref:hypothetical protein n=1 Tax=Pseudonocardia sp. TaxID=60912 RepID=UPI0031FC36ED
MSSAGEAGHELLLRLAGRLPDDVLWRLRDWLAAGAVDPVAALLPRALLRNRVALTESERELLVAAAGDGPQRRLIDAVLPLNGPDEPRYAFAAGPGLPDLAALGAMAVVRGDPGAVELRQSRRGSRGEQRVLLVLDAARPLELTGTLQRLLRAHGDRTPCVEVLPPGLEPPAYHQAAILGSAVLWSRIPRTASPEEEAVVPATTDDPAGTSTPTPSGAS